MNNSSFMPREYTLYTHLHSLGKGNWMDDKKCN